MQSNKTACIGWLIALECVNTEENVEKLLSAKLSVDPVVAGSSPVGVACF